MPTGLVGVYGQNLSDIALPVHWTWTDESAVLETGEQSYFARFDTTDYEAEYDFSAIDSYDVDAHCVEGKLSVSVAKAVPSYEVPQDLTVERGEALSAIALPEGFAWVDPSQTADELGEQVFEAVFTPEDTANYQTVTVSIPVTVVEKTDTGVTGGDEPTDDTPGATGGEPTDGDDASAVSSDKSDDGGATQTGDAGTPLALLAAAGLAAAGALAAACKRRRRQQ